MLQCPSGLKQGYFRNFRSTFMLYHYRAFIAFVFHDTWLSRTSTFYLQWDARSIELGPSQSKNQLLKINHTK